MVKIRIGDIVVITDPDVSWIPRADRGHQGEVLEVTPRHNYGRLVMLDGPHRGTRWNFGYEGVDVLHGPW